MSAPRKAPRRVQTVEIPHRAHPVGDPVQRPVPGRADRHGERLELLGDPLGVELVAERLRRRIPRVVRAVQAHGVVDADVQDFFQRVLGEEIDFLVAIIAQVVVPVLFRAGAIVGQLAEVSAGRPLRGPRGLDLPASRQSQPQGKPAKRETRNARHDRRHVLLRERSLTGVATPPNITMLFPNTLIPQLGWVGPLKSFIPSVPASSDPDRGSAM